MISRTSFKHRSLVLLFVGLGLLLAIWIYSGSKPIEGGVAIAAHQSTSRKSPVVTPSPEPRSASTTQPKDPPPVIDEIKVEKEEVCSGEENLISVRAHTSNGTNSHLHYVIGNATGAQAPMRVWLKPDGSYEKPKLSVFGRNNVVTEAEVPAYRVKDCKPARNAFVSFRLLPNALDEYEFEARIVEVGSKDDPNAKPFKPVKYFWSFGDESTAATTVPVVTHNYEDRSQETLYSQFLISVEVTSESGETVIGRTSFQMLNSAFENLDKKGIVVLMTEGTPRFPEVGPDGIVRQSFRVWHNRKKPVSVNKLGVVRYYSGGQPQTGLQELSPAAILGATEIPPGRGIEVSVQLDTNPNPNLSMVNYYLQGTTVEGLPVRGAFSLMAPPPKPTKQNSTIIEDPILLAKVKMTRDFLQKDFVTDEDIWKLEREGRFSDLKKEVKSEPSRSVNPNAASTSQR